MAGATDPFHTSWTYLGPNDRTDPGASVAPVASGRPPRRGPLAQAAPHDGERARGSAVVVETGALPGKPAQQPDLPVLLPQQALVPAAGRVIPHQVEPVLRTGREVKDEPAQAGVTDRGPGAG
jgi:hypothetical protein